MSLGKEAKREIARELRAWGVRADRGKWHRKIINDALHVVESCHGSTTIKNPKKSTLKMLPENIEEAVAIIFRADIQGVDEKRCRFTLDSIAGSGSTPPYIVSDCESDPSKFHTRVKWEYNRLGPDDFDPLNRFEFKKVSKREFFVQKWRNRSASSAVYQGHVFEALVVSHAIHSKQACACCMARNCLRWNGGTDAPWMDMVCVNCGSCYEIKSKQNMEAIERDNEDGVIRGGSYSDFFALHARTKPQAWMEALPRGS